MSSISPSKRSFTAALIGCGRIGFLLERDPLRYKPCTHYGGATAAGIAITHACDSNRDRLEQFSRLAHIPREYISTDYRELMNTAQPELVIIATWTGSHAAIGRFAAEKGARVIICEKPIAASLSDAQHLLQVCDSHRVGVIINHERRYAGRYRTVKGMLEKNRIGEVKTVHASILTSGAGGIASVEEGGGPLLHDGTHLIDIIRYLFGEITTVQGDFQKGSRGYEERVAAWLKMETGIDVFLEAGGNRNYYVFELQISGSEGKIIIGNGYEHLFLSRKSKLYTGFRDLEEAPFPRRKSMNPFIREYREAKNLLAGRNTEITSTGHDGYKALEVIHTIYLSAHLNGKKIEFPHQHTIDINEIFTR